MTPAEPVSGDFAPGRPVPVRAILAPYRRGASDPTFGVAGGYLWRAVQTPDGPATLRLHRESAPVGQRAVAHSWGPGAAWVVERLPGLLGAADDVRGFRPQHRVLSEVAARHPHWRIARSELILDSLLPAVIEQRVIGHQAFGAHRRLICEYGSPAPGPPGTVAALGLRVPPDVDRWRRIPSWQWLRAGVDAQRADTIQRVLRVADRLTECATLPRETAWQRLRSVPGIGVWTAAETLQRAAGDADAVSFGDYHVAKDLGYALTGSPVDDRQLEHVLRPYAGHRYRVQALMVAAGLRAPRRAPRSSVPGHLPH